MTISRIVVAFGANEQWDIVGDSGMMNEQYSALVEALQAVDGISDRCFELEGFRNSADRKSERLLVRVEDIKGVDIQEM